MHKCIDEVNAIILTYYRLPENLKEKLDAYIERGFENYKKGTIFKVDKAQEFDFTHKSIESLNKYIKEQELQTYFFKEAFEFYKELAIFLIQEKVRSNDIFINYSW